MRARRARRTRGWAVRATQALALAGWAALVYVVVDLEPERLASRAAILAALGVAVFATFGLAAYAASFALFADERLRGNLRRSLWQGAIAAAVCLAAALLRLGDSLTLLAGGVLLAVFLVGQIAVLVRE